jgi:2-oxo-hept-3-ene-1,7-dioate hydratase
MLRKALPGPHCTIFEVLNAVDFVVPAIEIIDARIHQIDPETKVPRRVTDTISDNAACAGIVLGGRPIRPMDVDLRWVAAVLYRNGALEESGVAAAVLNHPANGVVWLANKLAHHQVSLQAGELILGGSFTRPINAQPGDTFHVDYRELGSISFRFSAK